jgi:hypothetical protein
MRGRSGHLLDRRDPQVTLALVQFDLDAAESVLVWVVAVLARSSGRGFPDYHVPALGRRNLNE